MYETAYTMMELYTPAWVKKYVPPYKRFADLLRTCSSGTVFLLQVCRQSTCHSNLQRAYRRGQKRNVPADKLLIYNVKEGWQPLCNFLGVTIPDATPFPHVNDHETVKAQIDRARRMYQVIPIAALSSFF